MAPGQAFLQALRPSPASFVTAPMLHVWRRSTEAHSLAPFLLFMIYLTMLSASQTG
jgi:hypothetical protein